MLRKSFQSLSYKIWLLILVGYCTTFIIYHSGSGRREIIVSDGYAYYAILPATFLYKDVKFTYVNNLPGNLYIKYWLTTYPEEQLRISKMTIGTAALMMPFFLAGHAYAKIFHYPLTGYSNPYQDAIAVAALVYSLLGIYFVRKSLLKLFDEKVTSLALIVLVCATTFFNYTFREASMSHIYSFFAFSLMVWFTIRWHETFTAKHFFWLSFSFALIALIRPFNLMAGLFPILYGMQNEELRKKKINFLLNWKMLAGGVLVFALTVFPQSLMWKLQTGKWFFDGYKMEHFYFSNPHIADILVGFRNGWLIYTPIMIISVVGIIIGLVKRKPFAFPLIVFFPIAVYVLSCWWCWTFGGAFGYRPFLDFYPMLLLPAAGFIESIPKVKAVRAISAVFLLFFIYLNFIQTIQYSRGILHYSDMTAKAYAAIFGKTTYPPGLNALLDPFDSENAHAGKPMRNMRKFEDFGYYKTYEETLAIRDENGKFLSADKNNNMMLCANRDAAGGWETFSIIHFQNNQCAIRAWNKCYLMCLGWGEQKAEMDLVTKEEIFEYVDLGNNKFALKAFNGKFLRVQITEPFLVLAISDGIVEGCSFTKDKI